MGGDRLGTEVLHQGRRIVIDVYEEWQTVTRRANNQSEAEHEWNEENGGEWGEWGEVGRENEVREPLGVLKDKTIKVNKFVMIDLRFTPVSYIHS